MSETVRLYELSDAYRQLMADIDEAGGELTPELEQVLEALESSTTGKVDAICRMRQEFVVSVVAAKEEIDRVSRRVRSWARAIDKLDEYLFYCLERAGRDEVKTPLFTTRIQKSSPSARWTGTDEEIPEEFRRVVPERLEFDARAALKAFREGRELPAKLEVTQGKHLVVR